MSAAASLAYSYRYAFASGLRDEASGLGLRLATSGGAEPNPHFFRGKMAYPKEIADQLLTVAQVVSTRFWEPINAATRAAMLDPVVTANDGVLRFEGFSSCCGVYARADIKAEAFEADLHGRGTTNVDFNAAMRASLARIRDSDPVTLSVGADRVVLESAGGEVVEKKVKLPVRWIKGFTEVQSYEPALTLRLQVTGGEARAFLRGLPRGVAARQPGWVVPLGKGLRLSMRETKEGVRVEGVERLRVLEPLAVAASGLRVWADAASGVSAWELTFRSGRFNLMISPSLSRGFSGEGQALTRLARRDWEAALPKVQAQLAWQSRITVPELVERLGHPTAQIEAALAALGARGLLGYDCAEGAYYHRELPFDLQAIESLQPRLKGARKLIAEGKAQISEKTGQGESLKALVLVQGEGTTHRVRLDPQGDKCTCPWHSKHQGQRGACKHVLAARMAVGDLDEPESPPGPDVWPLDPEASDSPGAA